MPACLFASKTLKTSNRRSGGRHSVGQAQEFRPPLLAQLAAGLTSAAALAPPSSVEHPEAVLAGHRVSATFSQKRRWPCQVSHRTVRAIVTTSLTGSALLFLFFLLLSSPRLALFFLLPLLFTFLYYFFSLLTFLHYYSFLKKKRKHVLHLLLFFSTFFTPLPFCFFQKKKIRRACEPRVCITWTSSSSLRVAILVSQVVPVLSQLECCFSVSTLRQKRPSCSSMAGPWVCFFSLVSSIGISGTSSSAIMLITKRIPRGTPSILWIAPRRMVGFMSKRRWIFAYAHRLAS